MFSKHTLSNMSEAWSNFRIRLKYGQYDKQVFLIIGLCVGVTGALYVR